jgi:hypothetical protein
MRLGRIKTLYEYTDKSGCCLYSVFSFISAGAMGCFSLYLFIQALFSLGWLFFILILIVVGLPMLLYSLLIGIPVDFVQFMLFVPVIRLKAWEDRMHISIGMFSWPYKRIMKDEIISINATPEPLSKYAGRFGFRPPKGWKKYFLTTADRGLMIVTVNAKYLVNCPDPDEAETILNEIFNLAATVPAPIISRNIL